jgi:hypothetical protein
MNTTKPNNTDAPAKARFRLGATIFIIGFCSPLLIPLVTATDLPTTWKATLSGALAIGIPELFSIIAIAIMGKPGFQQLKAIFFRFIKKYGPPEKVSRGRYRVGLVMFTFPLLMAWLLPYFGKMIPVYRENLIPFSIAGDLLFISSVFVLGGEFWDKLQALFVYEARVDIK